MGVVEIEPQDMDAFKKLLADAGDSLVVIDFFAEWCGPCKMIAPKIEAFSKEYSNVIFYKMDVDKCEVAEGLGISAMPTFRFYKNNEQVCEVVGASEAKIKENIEKHK